MHFLISQSSPSINKYLLVCSFMEFHDNDKPGALAHLIINYNIYKNTNKCDFLSLYFCRLSSDDQIRCPTQIQTDFPTLQSYDFLFYFVTLSLLAALSHLF